MDGNLFTIKTRSRQLVNTDPQRRCYNGCHFSSELQWTEWSKLGSSGPEDALRNRLEFWRELNDYAISQRGESARSEFKIEKEVILPCKDLQKATASEVSS